MTDIFHEVNEEVRREQFNRLWSRYGSLLIVLAVLIVAGVAGWRGYQWYQSREAAASSVAYDAASDLAQQGKLPEAEAAFARLATEGTAGYRVLARLRAAAAEANTEAAVAGYDSVAGDQSVDANLRALASVRAALLLIDTAPLADVTRRLEPLTAADGAFRHTARELLVLAAVRAGDAGAAKRWADMVVADADTPQGIRARIDVLLALNEGGKS